ncbi:MAG TPA: hypothetical protein DCM62_08840 [Bacteroidales bacterium]|nr:hypothetical protein [Bacteroidales bacterium]
MKKLLVVLALVAGVLMSPVMLRANGPAIDFTLERIDLGTIFSDQLPAFSYNIEFTNTGNAPLSLSAVRACCGTRVVSWPQEPVNPGQKGIIAIEFRLAPRAQRVNRTVTVTSNDPSQPTSIFRIVGQIVDR